MNADIAITSCSSFSERSSFESYVQLLNKTFAGNFSLTQTYCKKEICDALYGSGNSDISGVGVAVGYVLSNTLGLMFALSTLPIVRNIAKRIFTSKSAFSESSFSSVISAYHDSATLLALSIQIASLVMLIRADFGISASGMGNFTVQITRTTSILVILPLLYCAFMPGLTGVSRRQDTRSEQEVEASVEGPANLIPKEELWNWNETHWRANLRIYLFIACWALSVYPFISRMVQTFGPSKICDGCAGGAISTTDWLEIENSCIGGVKGPSKSQCWQWIGLAWI